MTSQNIKYQKSQISKWILILVTISFPLIASSYYYKWGNHPTSLLTLGLVILVLFIVSVLFYKLTIKIDGTNISAIFGIGLIKKSMPLNDIDANSIEEIKIPWYTGIGIRVTKYGVLYNTKPGKALRLKSKSKNKTFLVGTDDYIQIKEILLKSIKE